MDLFLRYRSLLKADGTNQLQRLLPALEQGYVRPDERTRGQLLAYARALASDLRFYALSGQPAGDWTPLFDALLGADGQLLSDEQLDVLLDERQNLPAHVTLLLACVEVFRELQRDLNELPGQHLRHYYERELLLPKKEPLGDRLHVVFELARNASQQRLEARTLLDGGKDALGQPLRYALTSELIVHRGQLVDIRRLVTETDRRGVRRLFLSDAVSELESPGWGTFGQSQLELDASQRFMLEPSLGFAVASPVLRLAEGARRVELQAELGTSGAALPAAQELSLVAEVSVTSAEGWLVAVEPRVALVRPPSGGLRLLVAFDIDEAAAAIVDFDATLHAAALSARWPVLRCVFRSDSGVHQLLEPLFLRSADISVSASGVRSLVVQNDAGTLDPTQPMPVFTTQPSIGSRFLIGSAEVFGKRLTSLQLDLEWKDTPEDFVTHYAGYFDVTGPLLEERLNFLCQVKLLYARRWESLGLEQSLFGSASLAHKQLSVGAGSFATVPGYEEQPSLQPGASFDASSKYGFLALELRHPTRVDLEGHATLVPFEAFGHRAFAQRYALAALAIARQQPVSLPNEPYTPVLTGLSASYTARAQLVVGDVDAHEQFFTLTPWGYDEASAARPARLVPELPNHAELRLGFEGLTPPSTLSLLFEVEEGTATSAQALGPGEVEWSYLAVDRWLVLPARDVLVDATLGFQTTGLVQLVIPAEASTNHTLMPAGRVWLRASITKPPEAAARTRAVWTQAALAELDPGPADLTAYESHLQSPLPAGTVSRLVRRSAAIKAVRQPAASFGGRGGELDSEYFQRSSELLRHRSRAVTAWDFERLVLQEFPEIFKVKCLPHRNEHVASAPGELALVVVPDLRGPGRTRLLEPRASAVLVERIRQFLGRNATSQFAQLHVIHPLYERVRVDARVRFRPGFDPGFYSQQLDEALRRYLSPWAYEEGRDIVFGGKIYRSDIVAFMEAQPYVDNVTRVNVFHIHDGPRPGGIGHMQIGTDFSIRPDPTPAIAGMDIGTTFIVGVGVEAAEATRAHSVLCSYPEHHIEAHSTTSDVCVGVSQIGIGQMTVGLDFNVLAQ